jgi:hypothetical protein
MITQLEDLFIKMWRAASILSVFFIVYFAVVFTKGLEDGSIRSAIIVGALIASGIFAGSTAWAMRMLDKRAEANVLAEKQLKMSMRINQELQKLNAPKRVISKEVA